MHTFRRCLTACALITGLAGSASAQGFFATTSRDGVDAWAVGDSGRVLRTLDGGSNWTARTLGGTALRAAASRALVTLVVGDSGKVWRSADNGVTFSLAVLPGTPSLRAIAWPTPTRVIVVGSGGSVFRSDDAGVSWSPGNSGTASVLHAVAFADGDAGWAVGAGGTALRSVDGGANWVPAALSAGVDLHGVAAEGLRVWVVGARGSAWRSTNSGALFVPVDLRLDARSDVRAVALPAAGEVWLAGGGGFIRRSLDDGATWTFVRHSLHAPVVALGFAGGRGFAVASAARTPLAGARVDASWNLPTGATVTRSWTQVRSTPSSVRGSTINFNPWQPQVVYALLGATLWRSPDHGETWNSVGSIPNVNRSNSLVISPKDTSIMVAAVVLGTGSRQLVRSTDGGQTWVQVLAVSFGEYGLPLEIHPDKPDTMYVGGDNQVLQRSVDAGATWAAWPLAGGKVFRSPCDIVVVPGADSSILFVGDGITASGIGEIWRSNDGGQTFVLRQAVSGSEVPGLSTSRLRPSAAFATTWGTVGARWSSDFGRTWPLLPALNPPVSSYSASWGTDISRDDPDVVVIGQYSGSSVRLSLDGGATFSATTLSNANYSFLLRDRATIFAEQGNGIHKMRFAHAHAPGAPAASLALSVPDGGEVWGAGEVRTISWDASWVSTVRIEWRPDPGSGWQLVALADALAESFDWVVPAIATTTAEVRIVEWGGALVDASSAPFTITVPAAALLASPSPADLGDVDGTGGVAVLTLSNPGALTLNITSVTSDDADFTPVRTSLSIAGGASDTLSVRFQPSDAGQDSALITFASNASGSPHSVRVRANVLGSLSAPDDRPARLTLAQNSPNPFVQRTRIRFALPSAGPVRLEVFDLQGQRVATLVEGDHPAGWHVVDFGRHARGGAPLPGGVYFYRLTTPGASETRRLLLLP